MQLLVLAITADNFKLKHGLFTLVQNKLFFRHDKEDPHAHIRYFNKITSTLKFPNVSNTSIKLMLFLFSLEGAARIWLEKEPPRSIFTWDGLVSKFINQLFPPSKTTNLRNELTNFQQRYDKSFSEAWDRFKDLLRACPHNGFSKLHQLDTFYNALNSKDQDSLNSATGVVAKVSTNTSTFGISPDVAELKDMVKALLLEKKSQNQAPGIMKAVKESCVTCGGAHSYCNYPATDGNIYHDNIQEFVSQASAVNYNQGNTSYRPPMMSNQIRPLGFPPVVQSKSSILTSEPVNSPTIDPVTSPVSAPRPNQKPLIPYPSRLKDQKLCDKANDQREKFFQIFKDLNFNISFADALILMPKFGPSIKSLLTNKDKLYELARTLLNEHCSAVLLKNLPEKLGDPGKFLIPCDFPEKAECLALADLGRLNSKIYLPTLNMHFLEGDDKFPVIIAKDLSVEEKTALIIVLKLHKRAIAWKLSDIKDQEKTTFTSPYGTFAYRLIPFGLCDAPGTFQSCLSHFEKMLKRCEDTNLSLNRKKSNFMVKEGIVLGHKISKHRIEVDKAKFIKDFLKIARPMTRLLEKDTPFIFSKECIEAFQTLKRKLTEAPWTRILKKRTKTKQKMTKLNTKWKRSNKTKSIKAGSQKSKPVVNKSQL
nr:reverse transcriptase domain-containing protein [Tanacetum cinerariifolium]